MRAAYDLLTHMARFSRPKLFSITFNVPSATLKALGAFDPTLNVDTPLFIDPALLSHSRHPEMTMAVQSFQTYFAKIIGLLAVSNSVGDTSWRSASQLLRFPEITATCLGYGAGSIRGSGIGIGRRDQLMATAADIVRLGIRDPDLFVAMALFESGVGADRVGDMTTHVILPDLLAFNARVLAGTSVALERFELRPGLFTNLPRNPFETARTPVLLVPEDVLRPLPVATDWDSAMAAAAQNDDIRTALNSRVGEIWKEASSKSAKQKLRDFALSNQESFRRVLDIIRSISPTAYDQTTDPDGLVFWRSIGAKIVAEYPLQLITGAPKTADDARSIVEKIVERFRFLIEKRGLWSELYEPSGKQRHEGSAQKLFYAIADGYCAANNLDVTPEAETGNGPVDFKFSLGRAIRIIVEIKLSTNGKLVAGYDTQTPIYQSAEESAIGYYVVIDVGRMGKKLKRLFDRRNSIVKSGSKGLPKIELIDGTPKASASKRR